MATAKTGTFYLTETIVIPAGTASGGRIQGTIDLSAYVNAPSGQAISISAVDFVYQNGTDFGQDAASMLQGNGSISAQLTDLNPGTTFVRADNQSLVASAGLNIDIANSIVSHQADLYPDSFGNASLSETFMVVNDQLYLVAGPDLSAIAAAKDVYVTARCRVSVVKLGNKDWVSLALQSVASDN